MNYASRLIVIGLCLITVPIAAACKRTSPVVVDISPGAANPTDKDPDLAGNPTDEDPDLKLASQIELKRIHSGLSYGDDYSLTLHRGAGDIFAYATVVRTDLHTKKQRGGKLSAYYYNRLLQLIKSQGIMEMNDKYGMGTFDGLWVKLDVSIGNRHKNILTADEGAVPLKLWALYLAIDGAVASTDWNDAK